MDYLWLPPAFFVVALLYAAAGFGGGSSYLALLALTGLPAVAIRPLALVCNLVVTGGSSLSFARADVTPWRRALPLILASVPAAFFGGRVMLLQQHYLLLLGTLLVGAAALMLFQYQAGGAAGETPSGKGTVALATVTGAGVGFVSGVVGIGGGIFLSPLLFLTRWAGAREIAATTSLFILLNSLAGLAGQFSVGLALQWRLAGWLIAAVLLGGVAGTRLTLYRLPPRAIRSLAAVLILLVGLRLVWSNWLTIPL